VAFRHPARSNASETAFFHRLGYAFKPADGQSLHDVVPFKVEDGEISRPAPKALSIPLSDANDTGWYLSKMTPHGGTFLQPVKLSGRARKGREKDINPLTQISVCCVGCSICGVQG